MYTAMTRTLKVQVEIRRIPLSRASINAIQNLDSFDFVVFTSKNARMLFRQVLMEERIKISVPFISVGPRHDLLNFDFNLKRILFPRSSIAPTDIIRKLRARGATVRVIPLYMTSGAALSQKDKNALENGAVTKLYFRSASGVSGLLSQLRGKLRKKVLHLPAECIGKTTAAYARRIGFRHVSIVGVL